MTKQDLPRLSDEEREAVESGYVLIAASVANNPLEHIAEANRIVRNRCPVRAFVALLTQRDAQP